MELRTSTFLALRIFPTGRALFALRLARTAAERLGELALVAKIDVAIGAASAARQLERRWAVQRAQGASRARRAVTEADNALDAEVAGFDRVLATEANRWKRRDPERTDRIQAVRQLLFPQGVSKVLGAVYPEELAAIDDLRALCDASHPRHDVAAAGLVSELALGGDLAEIGRLADTLRALMAREAPDRLDFKAVQAARAVAQDALAAVVVQALAATEATAPEDTAAAIGRRAELLGAIVDQDEAIRAYNLQSRDVPDVDPQTGATADATLDAPAQGPAEG